MIRIGRESQCLPYAGFFYQQLLISTFSSQIYNDYEMSECKVCEKKFISKKASQDHDRKLQLTLGPGKKVKYKCDYCKALHTYREQLFEHITNKPRICTIFEKKFPTQTSFENHNKLNLQKQTKNLKHTLEREPSLKFFLN